MRIIFAAAAIAAVFALQACNSPAIPPGNYGSVAGTITNTSGQPLAGATVQVDFGPSGTSGPDGKYIVNTVPVHPPGTPAHVEVATVPTGYRKPPPRDDVQVVAGQTTPNVNFVLQPG
jgi:hypothetical protein